MKINVAIIGCGNIGKAALEAVLAAPDMNYVGSYHHNDDLEKIKADVALLCVPTRQVPEFAEKIARYSLKIGSWSANDCFLYVDYTGISARII